jgi:cysteine desulfurase
MTASTLGVNRSEIVFCASGTEAVNLALLGAGRKLPLWNRIVTWAAEHHCVIGAVRQLELEGHPISILPVDELARARPAEIPGDTGMVSISLANNENGTLQPVAEVVEQARRLGALIHIDACQGPQWLDPDVTRADLASFSGHKIGAGCGGLLWAREDIRLLPLQFGGPQEWGRRAGWEDVRGAVAIATALNVIAARRGDESRRARDLASALRESLSKLGATPTGGPQSLPNYASAAFSQVRGEDLLLALDLEGVAASSGSACASGSLDPSHVLLAMGLSLEQSLGSLRLTTGYRTTSEEVDAACAILDRVLRRLLAVQTRA